MDEDFTFCKIYHEIVSNTAWNHSRIAPDLIDLGAASCFFDDALLKANNQEGVMYTGLRHPAVLSAYVIGFIILAIGGPGANFLIRETFERANYDILLYTTARWIEKYYASTVDIVYIGSVTMRY